MIARGLLAALCLLLASGATGSPPTIAPGGAGETSAERSFSRFAERWMDRALARGERDRSAPRAHPVSEGLVFTYRTVGERFETELRPTGRAGAPFIGVLHYTEHTFTCSDVRGRGCEVTSSLPVTEVFRYRDGRWSY